jgi:hypothetical protein
LPIQKEERGKKKKKKKKKKAQTSPAKWSFNQRFLKHNEHEVTAYKAQCFFRASNHRKKRKKKKAKKAIRTCKKGKRKTHLLHGSENARNFKVQTCPGNSSPKFVKQILLDVIDQSQYFRVGIVGLLLALFLE